jgi:hypothetical protein
MSLFKGITLLCVSVCAREMSDRERRWNTFDEVHSFFLSSYLAQFTPPPQLPQRQWLLTSLPLSLSSLCATVRALPFLTCRRIFKEILRNRLGLLWG